MPSVSLDLSHELFCFLKEYEALANKCDFDLLIPYIAEDAVYWFSNGSYRGIQAIRKAFEDTWNTIKNEKYTIRDIEWLTVTDTSAMSIYTFHSDGFVDGRKQEYIGRGTNILQKKAGKWKIVHEHLSKAL